MYTLPFIFLKIVDLWRLVSCRYKAFHHHLTSKIKSHPQTSKSAVSSAVLILKIWWFQLKKTFSPNQYHRKCNYSQNFLFGVITVCTTMPVSHSCWDLHWRQWLDIKDNRTRRSKQIKMCVFVKWCCFKEYKWHGN